MTTQTIQSRYDGHVLYTCEAGSLLAAVQEAVRAGANLARANLVGANLVGAYLVGANLARANLDGANLDGAIINWLSHRLVGELLFRAAEGDIDKRKVAGLISLSRDWCWNQFLEANDPLREWALGVLREYVTDADGAPKVLVEKGTRVGARR